MKCIECGVETTHDLCDRCLKREEQRLDYLCEKVEREFRGDFDEDGKADNSFGNDFDYGVVRGEVKR